MKHTHDWEHYIGIWYDGDNEFRVYRCECGAVLTQSCDGDEFIHAPSGKEEKQ